MTMYFSEKFKQLRRNYDLTQDQLADIFHVSPQTVSRWETGANYPDIELLPHIAIFFKVTIDELLGKDLIISENKVAEYIRDIRNFLNVGKVYDAIDVARKAVKEYPVNYDLQSQLMHTLCTSCSEDSPDCIKNTKEFKNEIISIGERIINYCTNQDTSLWTKWQLFRQYIKWDMKDDAKKILYTLPSEVWYTQDVNIGAVLEGKEWADNQLHRIGRFAILLCDTIEVYADKADLGPLEKIKWYKKSMQIYSEIYEDEGDLIVHSNRDFANVLIAELYCVAGDIENALNYVENATQDAIYHSNHMDKDREHGYFPWPTKRNICWIIWEDFLMKPEFDVLRNNNRFNKCLELLKSNSHELE